jgi:ribosomal-protein-alanine N-acetyltransferase
LEKIVKIIETERLILRQFTTRDAAFILDLLNQPSFLKHIGDRGVRNIADAEKYILNGPIDSYKRLGFGYQLCVYRRGAFFN